MERRPNGRAADSRHAAEENAAGWLRYWGYADAVVIPADSGVAVRSRNALAQVRFEAYDIDQPDLQRLVGARRLGKESLFFFTGSGFSTAATEYADLMGICLVKYDLSGAVLPLNAAAGRIAADRRHDWALRHRELTRLATAGARSAYRVREPPTTSARNTRI